jgi:hypothetical protein
MGQDQSTQAPPPEDAGADEQAKEPTVLVAAFLALLLVLIASLHALAEQVSQHQAAHATAPEHAATDQQADEPPLVVAAFLAFLAFLALFLFVFVALPHPLAQQVGEEHATQTAALQPSSDQQAGEPMLLLTPFLAFALDVFIIVAMLAFGRCVGRHKNYPPQLVEQKDGHGAQAEAST